MLNFPNFPAKQTQNFDKRMYIFDSILKWAITAPSIAKICTYLKTKKDLEEKSILDIFSSSLKDVNQPKFLLQRGPALRPSPAYKYKEQKLEKSTKKSPCSQLNASCENMENNK